MTISFVLDWPSFWVGVVVAYVAAVVVVVGGAVVQFRKQQRLGGKRLK